MRWLMLAVLCVVRLAMGYQFQSVASVSNQLVEEFGFSYAQIGTLIGFFLLPGVLIAMPSGALTRAASDKTLLMIGAAVMAAGSTMMGMTETATQFYVGRLMTGVGATIFNVVLTKMVSDWFFGKEIITALSIMLVSWPVGIALGLLTQSTIAQAYGWPSVMIACTAAAVLAFVLTAGAYRAPPARSAHRDAEPLRFGLPAREAVHISVVGIAWAAYNAGLILPVSFGPDALVAQGWTITGAQSAASLTMWAVMISLPLGGRLMEKFGYVTIATAVFLLLAAGSTILIFRGVAPTATFLVFGLAAGVPAGALVALSSEAALAENRGPGLGIFYTWYYAGMALAPWFAGWVRDTVRHPGAPLIIAGALMVVTVGAVLLLRLLQAYWPIRPLSARPKSRFA